MNRLNRLRSAYHVSLFTAGKEEDAWGTDFGIKVADGISRALGGLSEGTLVTFDYTGIRRADPSFQREAIIEPVRRHRPRLLFIVEGIKNPDIRSNLELALEQRGLMLLCRGEAGKPPQAIGANNPTLLETLKAVSGLEEVTSDFLRDELKLTPPNATNRLNSLASAGLIERTGGSASGGGRQYKYYPIR